MSSSKPLLGLVVLALALPASAAEDLRALEVSGPTRPIAGADAARSLRVPQLGHRADRRIAGRRPRRRRAAGRPAERRRERIDRAIVGAAIGGTIGSILGDGRHHHDSNEDVLAGAAAGAAIGAATAGNGGSQRPRRPRSRGAERLSARVDGLPRRPRLFGFVADYRGARGEPLTRGGRSSACASATSIVGY